MRVCFCLIDIETQQMTTFRRHDGAYLDLVMSDEFNVDGRHFEEDQDLMFEALNKPDFTNQALQFCNDDNSSHHVPCITNDFYDR